jgi:chloramphenicol 3-O-phosphotransferase
MQVYRWLRSAEFFLMAKQAAFDTSWMNLGAEAFLDALHQVRQSNG